MGSAEFVVEGYLCKQAQRHGLLCYKFMSGVNGVPDRVLIGYGRTVFVETKSSTGALRPLQRSVIRRMREHGAVVCVLNDRRQVDALIARIIDHPTSLDASCSMADIGVY